MTRRTPGAARDARALGRQRRARPCSRSVADNADALDVTDFSARYVDETGRGRRRRLVDRGGGLTWAFEGFDDEPASAEVAVTFVPDGEAVAIRRVRRDRRRHRAALAAGAAGGAPSGRALVMVAASRSSADPGGRGVRANGSPGAQEVVRRVLPAWRAVGGRRGARVAAALDATLDAADGTYAGIAAVTTTVDGSGSPDAPVHVFVNPDVTRGLRGAGAQVVMSHELVHVATDAATSTVDLWLLEGFADYVALRDVPLPLSHHRRAGDRPRAPRRPARAACPGRRTSTPGPPTSRPPTSWRGWPATRWPTRWGSEALLDVYRRASAGDARG